MMKVIKAGLIGGLILIAFMTYVISQSETPRAIPSAPSSSSATTIQKSRGLTAAEVKQLGQFTEVSGKNVQAAISQASTGNPAHEALTAKSDSEKAQALALLLEQSNKPCGFGRQSFFQGLDQSRNAYWNIRCSNGRDYSIQIQADAMGSTKIASCDFMKSINVMCFEKLNIAG